MKENLRNILISLLYFTPIGYLLKLISLNTGKSTPGVFVKMKRHEPVTVVVKKDATISDRVHWFVNGALLLPQAYYVINYQVGGDFGGAYAYTALIFGVVNIISAFFPTIANNITAYTAKRDMIKRLIPIVTSKLAGKDAVLAELLEAANDNINFYEEKIRDHTSEEWVKQTLAKNNESEQPNIWQNGLEVT